MKEYKTPDEEVSQFSELDLTGTYSYAEYLKWTFDERLELIKGKIFPMSPAPARRHQKILQQINRDLLNFLRNYKCEVYPAPFDVRLPTKNKSGSAKTIDDKEIFTVVQPDLCVICDESKLDDRGCIGAPDIIVEILSPGNSKKELSHKYDVYEEAGVKEYWIVGPEHKTFIRYVLDENGKYQPTKAITQGDEVITPILPGFVLKLDEVFRD